jgi:hypothetical protein
MLDALDLASEPELFLLGRQFARGVPFELDPHGVDANPDPEIGRSGGGFRGLMSHVPNERDLFVRTAFGILEQQPVAKL